MPEPAQPTPGFPAIPRGKFLAMAIGFEGGLIVVAWGLGLATGERFWTTIDPSLGALALGAALSLPFILGAIAIAETDWALLRRMRRDFALVVTLFRECTAADILLISLLAGVGEEALFRGVLQPWLAGFTGPAAALVIASLVFGALHYLSHSYFIFATLIGLFLGGLYLWLGNLFVPIAVHAIYDFAALMYGVRIRPIQAPVSS